MRHNIKHKKLNMTSSHKISMFRNMSVSLLEHEQIVTTLPKAKSLRSVVEKLITFGKKGDLNSRRIAFSKLRDDGIVAKLFSVIADRYKNRNGGYTRILKSGNRYGDNAPTAVIELVDRDPGAKGKRQRDYLKKQDELKKKNSPSSVISPEGVDSNLQNQGK